MFDTLLVANRGEIACRVIRTARAMGLRTVAVHSEADRDALHVRLADFAVAIGPAPARASYLDGERILRACRAAGAQAVHPGYGFLSERADFARACRDAGIVFVGPTPEAIDALGDKSAAKRLAASLGLPCLPGYAGADQRVETLLAEAQRLGAPLMIKAAAGGGGRGMRRCDDLRDRPALAALLEAARAEAAAAFGDGDLLLERLLEGARHVEVQVVGDGHGRAVHLGERDCSVQRRHQKVIEEAPAPGLSAGLRTRMGEAAVRLASAVGYGGAGTVEFLVAPDGGYFFLEMNTRLQVEHPVTEAVTGIDLVEWQLRVARGEPLPLAQDEVRWRGHAIEARLCAEDPFADDAPQVGTIAAWHAPAGPGLRIDHGLAPRASVTPHFDSLIAKLVAVDADRDAARRRLVAALEDTSVLGVATNRELLLACLRDREFTAGAVSTGWLEAVKTGWRPRGVDARWLAVAALLTASRRAARHGPLAFWSSDGRIEARMRLAAGGSEHEVALAWAVGSIPRATIGGESVAVRLAHDDGVEARIEVDGVRHSVRASLDGDAGWLDAFGCSAAFADVGAVPRPGREDGRGTTIVARMHGQLARLAVRPGQRVQRGEFVLAIEAMKMEHRFEAPVAGTVLEVGAAIGAQIAPGRLLVRIEPNAG